MFEYVLMLFYRVVILIIFIIVYLSFTEHVCSMEVRTAFYTIHTIKLISSTLASIVTIYI